MAVTGSVSSRVSLRGRSWPLHRLEGLEGLDEEEESLGHGIDWAWAMLGALPAEGCSWRTGLGISMG